MPLPVNKTKLRGERSKLFFDFADILDFGEILSTWNVTATPIVGTDTQANEMVFLLQETTPTTAVQYVVVGEPGVIYEFRCEALTSIGRTLVKEQTLAVLPSVSLFPPLFGVPFTSPPYPVQIGPDDVLAGFNFLDGILKNLITLYSCPDEALLGGFAFTEGTLRTPLVTYTYTEAQSADFNFVSGTLRNILVRYSYTEAQDVNFTFVSGALRVILITYSYVEAQDVAFQFIDGTLV